MATNKFGRRGFFTAMMLAGAVAMTGTIRGYAQTVTPDNGPLAGGNFVAITNSPLGSGADITNVTVGGVTATIVGQGANWVHITAPPGAYAGTKTIVVRSASVGATTLANAYAYNPAGVIGALEHEWLPVGANLVPGQPVAKGANNTVYTLSAGADRTLYAGGAFTNVGGSNCFRVARYDGANWSSMGIGVTRVANVNTLYAGSNGAVFCGGYYTNIGGTNTWAVGMWDGAKWNVMGERGATSGKSGLYFSKNVNGYANKIFQASNGAVYAGGYFTNTSDRFHVRYIAKYTGGAWTNMAHGFSNVVMDIAEGKDGTIYACGSFTNTYGNSRHLGFIAKWNGAGWTNVGAGLGNRVTCMKVAPNGDLYVGGWFTNYVNADGTKGPARYVAKWNGSNWTNVGAGFNNWVYDLEVGKDGTVYAGGSFTTTYNSVIVNTNAPLRPANRVARFDGTYWWPMEDDGNTKDVGGMSDSVLALAVDPVDDTLYAGGFFRRAGTNQAWYVAKWASAGSIPGVVPDIGPATGGFELVISGANLTDSTDPTDLTDVTLCGASVASIVSASATQVVVVAGATMTPGVGDVRVFSTAYGETVASNAFTYEAVPPAGIQVLGTNGLVVSNGAAPSADAGTLFARIKAGTAITNTFAITNDGVAPLEITGVVTGGPAAAAFEISNLKFEIPAGVVSNFTIAYKPSAGGSHAAAFIISNNAPDGVYTVNVAGVAWQVTPDNGPLAGGNIVTITNGMLGAGADIYSVTIGGVDGTIASQGATWLTFIAGSNLTTGLKDIVVRSASEGTITMAEAYTVNPAGSISGGGGVQLMDYRVNFFGGNSTDPNKNILYPTNTAPDGVGRWTYYNWDMTNGASVELMSTNSLTNGVYLAALGYSTPYATDGIKTAGYDWIAQICATNFIYYSGAGTTNRVVITNLPGASYQIDFFGGYGVVGHKFNTKLMFGVWSLGDDPGGGSWGANASVWQNPGGGGNNMDCTNAAVYPDRYVTWTNVAPSNGAISLMQWNIGNHNFLNCIRIRGYEPTGGGGGIGVTPSSGALAGGYPVTISGSNLCNGTMGDVTGVWLAGVQAAVQSVAGTTQIVVTAGAALYGRTGEVRVESTSHGATARADAFTYMDTADFRVLGTNGHLVASDETPLAERGTDFGKVFTNAAATNVFVITNAGAVDVTISGWATNGAGADSFIVLDCPPAVAAGTASNLIVAFAPQAAGALTACVVITNSDAASPFLLNLAGRGGAGSLTVSGDGAFGDVLTGRPDIHSFTLRNVGASTVTISTIQTNGADAAQFAASGIPCSLAAGAAAEFTVTFTPATDGAKSATLVIETCELDLAGTGCTEQRFAILGTNGAAIAAASAPSESAGTDFGFVAREVAASRTFTITNAGNDTLYVWGATKDGAGADKFTVAGLPATVAGGAAATFTITFQDSTTGGLFDATVQLANSVVQSPFALNVQARAQEDGMTFASIPVTNATVGDLYNYEPRAVDLAAPALAIAYTASNVPPPFPAWLTFNPGGDYDVINTVAGNSIAIVTNDQTVYTSGYAGDGGAATNAALNASVAVAVDRLGVVYIADRGNNRIRRVAADGMIIAFAGNGDAGISGDGGMATNAGLGDIRQIALAPDGSLYIAASYTIRRVDTDGIIHRVAGTGAFGFSGVGGPATNAALGVLSGLTVDDQTNVYFTATGAGDRIARVDADGILYLAATNAVTLASGANLALDSVGRLIFAEQNRICRLETNGAINALVTGTAATLSGLAMNGDDTLYYAQNAQIHAMDAQSNTWILAGTGVSGFSGDGGAATNANLGNLALGLAVEQNGRVYAADEFVNRVRMIAPVPPGLSGIPAVPDAGTATTVTVYAANARTNVNQTFTITVDGCAQPEFLNVSNNPGFGGAGASFYQSFPTMPINQTTNLTLAITNSGTAVLQISGVTTSGMDAFEISDLIFAIPIGGASNVVVTFQPTTLGLQSAEFIIAHNGSNSPLRLAVSGSSILPGEMGADTASLQYNATYGGANPDNQTLALTNKGGLVYDYTNAVLGGDWFEFSPLTGMVDAAGAVSLTGTVDIAGLNAGTHILTNRIISATATNSPLDVLVRLDIEKATQNITYTPLGDQAVTNVIGLAATADSGAAVVFTVADGAAQIANDTNLTFQNVGYVTLLVRQPGNANYHAAPMLTNRFLVTNAIVAITINDATNRAYDGGLVTNINVTTVPPGVNCALSYNGMTNQPVNAGVYSLLAQSADWRYSGSASATMEIYRANAIVNLTVSNHTYDGTAKPVILTTTPTGLVTELRYNGLLDAPVNVGSYTAIVTVADGNYTGGATGVFSIVKAPQTVTFDAIVTQHWMDVTDVAPTSSSALAVTVEVVSGPGALAGGTAPTTMTYTNAGTVQVRATQNGDSNWNAAMAVTQTVTVVAPQAYFRGTNGVVLADNAAPAVSAGTDAGTLYVGAAVERVFTVTNSGAVALAVNGCEFSGAGASAFRSDDLFFNIEPGERRSFTVRFNPQAAGVQTAAMTVAHNAPDESFRINLAVTGYDPRMLALGTNGAAIYSGVAVSRAAGSDFGHVKTGSAVTNTFAVTNDGAHTLIISGTSTSGPAAGEFEISNLKFQIPAGAVSNFNVVYRPTGVARHTAALVVSNNTVDGEYLLNLAGSGFSVSPDHGPLSGGNIVAITNGVLGDGADILDVTVDGNTATIVGQDTNRVVIVMPAGNTTGMCDIVAHSSSLGDTFLPDAYTYNPPGTIVVPDVMMEYLVSFTGTNGSSVDISSGVDYPTNWSPQGQRLWTYVSPSNDWKELAATNIGTPLRNDVWIKTFGFSDSYDGGWRDMAGGLWWIATNAAQWFVYADHMCTNRIVITNLPGTNYTVEAVNSYAGILMRYNETLSSGYLQDGDEPGTNFGANIGAWQNPGGGGHMLNPTNVYWWRDRYVVWSNTAPQDKAFTLSLWNTNTIYGNLINCMRIRGVEPLGKPVAPASGWVTGGFEVVISGNNLTDPSDPTDLTDVTLCGYSAVSIVGASSDRVVVTAGAATAPGVGDVRVYSKAFGVTVASNAFTYIGPMLNVLGTNGAAITNSEPAGAAKGTDFGAWAWGTTLTNTLTITNTGNAVLNISAIATNSATPGVFRIAPAAMTVPVGGAVACPVICALANAGVFNAEFEIAGDAPASPMRLRVAATGVKCAQTITFDPIANQLATNRLGLFATAASGLNVLFTVGSGPAVLAGGTNLTFTGPGSVSIIASQSGNADWNSAANVTNTFDVTKAAAVVALTNLDHNYDGTAHGATAVTVPTGLTVNITYDGNGWVPTNSGVYAVTGLVDDVMYQGGATGLLNIGKAAQTISFPPIINQKTTNNTAISATASSGLTVEFELISGPAVLAGAPSPSSLTYTNAGTVVLRAVQAGDLNHESAMPVTNTFLVSKVTAGVTLTNLNQTYDGTARVVGYATSPTGVAVNVTYAGNVWAPTNAGTYRVTGTVDSVIYDGWSVDLLTVGKADQTIGAFLPADASTFAVASVQGLSATSSSELAVGFTVVSGAASISNGTNLAFSGLGAVQVAARQPGNANFNSAGLTNNYTVIGGVFNAIGADGLVFETSAQPTAARGTDYGMIPSGAVAVVALAITNAGTADLVISGWTTNGAGADWFTVTGMPEVVAAGGVSNFWAVYAPVATGLHQATIAIASDGLPSVFDLRLAATAIRPGEIGLNASMMSFTGTYGGTNPPMATYMITNKGDIAFDYSNTVSYGTGAGWFDIQASTGYLDPDVIHWHTGMVDIAGLDAGTYLATNTITGTASNAPVDMLIELAVNQTTQSISFAAIADQIATSATPVAATASSGLPVVFEVLSGPAVPADPASPTTLTYTNSGTVVIRAAQTGDVNHLPAPHVTNTFTVIKAPATVTFTNLNQTYNGAPRIAGIQTAPADLSVDVTYNGGYTPPTEAGSYAVTGVVNEALYQGAQTGILVVGKAPADVFLLNTTQNWNGEARHVTATTMPAGLQVDFTYDGHAWAPTNGGVYVVTGAVNEANHAGAATGSLTIVTLAQTITFPALPNCHIAGSIGLTATASSGLPVSFAAAAPGVVSAGTNLTFTAVGDVYVVASQTGNHAYAAAPPASNLVHVFALSTNRGPYAGGNTVVVSNGNFGVVTNVLVGALPAAMLASNAHSAAIVMPGAVNTGAVDIIVQTAGDGDIVLPGAYYYNPAGAIFDNYTAGWSAAWALPAARSRMMLCELNGALYAMGGVNSNDVGRTNIYRFDGETWTEATSMPMVMRDAALGVHDGALYVMGGLSLNYSPLNNVFRYDGDTWDEVAGLPMARRDAAAAAYNGALYLLGGSHDGVAASNVYVYNGVGWSETNSMPGAGMRAHAAVLDGLLYAMPGDTNNPELMFAFDGAQWVETNAAPATATPCGFAAVDDVIRAVGGAGALAAWQYDGVSWTAFEDFPDAGHDLVDDMGMAALGGLLYSAGGLATDDAGGVDVQTCYTNVYRYATNASVGVMPASGSWTGGYQVVLSGNNLTDSSDPSDLTNVTLCGVSAQSIVSASSTQIVVVAGAAPGAMTGDVRVFSVGFGQTVKHGAFTYMREPQAALQFNPASPQAYMSTNALTFTGGSGTGAVSFVVLDGPGVIVSDTNLAITASTGLVTVTAAKAQDIKYYAASVTAAVAAAKGHASVHVFNLAHIYDGTAKAAGATTMPSGLTVTFWYDGATSPAPVNARAYAVQGVVVDTDWQGAASNTLIIDKAAQTINFPAIPDQALSSVVHLAATAESGLPVTFSVTDGAGIITDATNLLCAGAGQIHVAARQAGNSNWHAAADMTNIVRVTEPAGGMLAIQVNPPDAAWRVQDPPEDYAGPRSGTGALAPIAAPPGLYTVAWDDLAGYLPPPARTAELIAGGALTFTGIWLEVTDDLPVPQGVAASDGVYTNFIRVSWRGIEALTRSVVLAYEIRRSTVNDPATAVWLAYVPAGVGVLNPLAGERLVSRSDVRSSGVAGAARVDARPPSEPESGVSSFKFQVSSFSYDDYAIISGVSYYYWVRARTATQVSRASYVGMGYAALAPDQTEGVADLAVSDVVFLPVNMRHDTFAGTISCRLANHGPDALVDRGVALDFYMGARLDDMLWIGGSQDSCTLAPGAEQLVIMTPQARRGVSARGDQAGSMTVRAHVRHLSDMLDPNLINNVSDAPGRVRVRADGYNSSGRSMTDTDGDGKSDALVLSAARDQFVALLSGQRFSHPAVAVTGTADARWLPALGDYDGDGVMDLGLYDPVCGMFHARFSSVGGIVHARLGGAGCRPVVADYDGDGKSDPALFHEAAGYWFGLMSADNYRMIYTTVGGPGYIPVPADYDGDAKADPVTYSADAGRWHGRLSRHGYMEAVMNFGQPGWAALAADFNGDGFADPGLYNEATGTWVVLLSNDGMSFTAAQAQLGGPGWCPAPGDYDGDGLTDPAVYNPLVYNPHHGWNEGFWYGMLSAQGYAMTEGWFGGPGYECAGE